MPDFESRRPSPPFFAAAGSTTDEDVNIDVDDGFDGELDERPLPREGLPPGYRMRHDAHYVDQLTARTGVPQIRVVPLREIDGGSAGASADLEPLVRSIAAVGLLQPLLVRSRSGRFDLIAGSRRLAAAALAGLTEVPCIVHACDDHHARGLEQASRVRAVSDTAPAAALPGPALAELGAGLGTIESCLHLLAARDRALPDRVALDLIRTEAHRASRLVRCLDVLTRDPELSQTGQPFGRVLEAALESIGPEARLSGVHIGTAAVDGTRHVHADPDWFTLAVAGAIGGLLPLLQNSRVKALDITPSAAAPRGSTMFEIVQTAVTPSPGALARFFDPQWVERPGGYHAAVQLAGARRIAELHHGGMEVVAGERAGCRVMLVVPSAE